MGAISVLTVVFAIVANTYFGNNWFPQSEAEVVADGIVFLMAALAIVAGQLQR